jgi:osmotically-inducible protein OsmY
MMYWLFPDDDSPADQEGSAESADEQIGRVVAGRLDDDPRTSRQHITVAVQNRVVVLIGSVQSPGLADLAGETAWGTPGVFDVCNALTWPGRYR